jgi:hypothetical protein
MGGDALLRLTHPTLTFLLDILFACSLILPLAFISTSVLI